MTTSNQTIYQLTRDDIIKGALRKLGRLAKGQTPDTEDYTNAQQSLNAIIAEYTTIGMQLWSRTDYTLTLVAGQKAYTMGIGQTINIPFPFKLLSVTLNNTGGGNIEVFPIAKQDFDLLTITSTGTPVNYTYQPFINYGTLTVWPTPDASVIANYTCVLTYQKQLQGFTTGTETPDFPQEWQNALIYALALDLAPEYGVPLMDISQLEKQADKHLMMAAMAGVEEASFYFQPDNMRRQDGGV